MASEQGGVRCYRIVRHYANGATPRTIRRNLTLEEAQAHCEREDTHEPGKWFDGYDWMPGYRPEGKR